MSQDDLNTELSRITGEELRTIRKRGFNMLQPLEDIDDEIDLDPQVIDWDSANSETCPMSQLVH